MKRIYWKHVAPLTLLAGLTTMAGCATQSDAEGTSTVAPQAQSTPAGATQASLQNSEAGGKLRGGRGPFMIFHLAMSELDLTTAQRTTLQGVVDGLHPAEGEHAAPTEIFSTLADGVRAGKIDQAALQAKVDALKSDHAQGPAKAAAAFQTLHDTLTAEQRTQLVASVRQRMDEREQKHASGEEEHAAEGDKPVAPFLHGIDLSDAQRTRVEQALSDAGWTKAEGKARFEQMRTKLQSALDAFAGDKFDAAALLPTMAQGPTDHLNKLVAALSAILPVLDDAQRAKLADNLAKGPMGHGGHGWHGGQKPGDVPADEEP